MGRGRRTPPACLLMVVSHSSLCHTARYGAVYQASQPRTLCVCLVVSSMPTLYRMSKDVAMARRSGLCRVQVCEPHCLTPALSRGCVQTCTCCEAMPGDGVWLLPAGLTIAGSRSAAYFEAQRRIAVTIRNMYEVGQRVPPLESAMSLSAAQAWDSSHREVSPSRKLHP